MKITALSLTLALAACASNQERYRVQPINQVVPSEQELEAMNALVQAAAKPQLSSKITGSKKQVELMLRTELEALGYKPEYSYSGVFSMLRPFSEQGTLSRMVLSVSEENGATTVGLSSLIVKKSNRETIRVSTKQELKPIGEWLDSLEI